MAHILGHHQASGTKLNANLNERVRSTNDAKSHEFSSKTTYLHAFPFKGPVCAAHANKIVARNNYNVAHFQ